MQAGELPEAELPLPPRDSQLVPAGQELLCPLNGRAEGLGQRVLLRCTGEEEGWEVGEHPGRYLGTGQGQQPKRETETASSRPSLHGHQGDMAS